MKKVVTLCLAASLAVGASAQATALENSKFLDNWSIGVNLGGVAPLAGHNFFDATRFAAGLELTKQITPVFGLGIQATTYFNTSNIEPAYHSTTVVDALDLSLLAKINLMNLFLRYNGSPRFFEIEAVAGIGWGHYFNNSEHSPIYDDEAVDVKYGLNFNFNLGKDKAWTVSLKPAVCYNLNDARIDVRRGAFELMVGGVYHFKNSNGTHHFKTARLYDQAEIDALNAKINDLRSTVSEKDSEIGQKDSEIRSLQQQLNECRNRQPAVEVKEVVNTTNIQTVNIHFAVGSSTVSASQQPNVELVGTYMKNHPEATVEIKGYASVDGNKEKNELLAAKRAEAVKTMLVNKYKIDSSRIKAEGNGIGEMFSEASWNRVSICTIEDAD